MIRKYINGYEFVCDGKARYRAVDLDGETWVAVSGRGFDPFLVDADGQKLKLEYVPLMHRGVQ